MGCGRSSGRYAVEVEIGTKPSATSFDELPQNGQTGPRSAASEQMSKSDALAAPTLPGPLGKYAPTGEIPTSFIQADADIIDFDADDELEVVRSESAAKMKMAEQFWATPTADALRMRAPASGHMLSSQKLNYKLKMVDDPAFCIPQDRRGQTNLNNGPAGLAGAGNMNSFLHPVAKPKHREQFMGARLFELDDDLN